MTNQSTKDILVVAATAATSIITVVVLAFVDRAVGFSLYGFMLWFIVPVGAILSGLVAASGYYLGARALNHRPSRFVLVGVLAISTMMFFLINYLEYYTQSSGGAQLHDYIAFPDYLNFTLNNMSMTLCYHACLHQGVGIGSFGYLIAALQIVGFFLGGVVAYALLSSEIYCDACARYYSAKFSTTRYFSESGSASSHYGEVLAMLRSRQYQEAIAGQAEAGSQTEQSGSLFASVIKVKWCKKCLRHQIRLSLKRRERKEWKELRVPVPVFFVTERLEPTAG